MTYHGLFRFVDGESPLIMVRFMISFGITSCLGRLYFPF